MSGGKETPRQKMIGMMYLFLTALMALNVSKEVVNSFVVIDEALEKTNESFVEKNEYMYNYLEQQKAIQGAEKVGPFADAAQEVKKLADELVQYINDSLRGNIIHRADGVSLDATDTVQGNEIQSKDNYDIPTNLMIGQTHDGSKGRARTLKNKLNDYKQKLGEILKNPKLKFKEPNEKIVEQFGDFGINTNDPEGVSQDKPEEKYWETSKFYHLPVVASLAMLSEIKNEVRNAEASVVNKLMNSIGATDFKFDKLEAKVIANSNYIVQGNKYEADLFVAAYSTTDKPTVWVGSGLDTTNPNEWKLKDPIDTVSVVNGMGKYIIDATSTGERTYAARIDIKDPSGAVKQYFTPEVKYTVAKPALVVSPTKMNVLYIGVDNPLEISVSGFASDKVRPSISNGSISKKSGAEYVAKVRKPGKARISVSVEMDNGDKKSMGFKEFRVKRVPDPIAKVGGKSQGNIRAGVLKAQAGVVAELENFEFDLKFLVTEFTLAANVNGYYVSQSTKGNRFNGKQMQIIKALKPNQKFFIEGIKAKRTGSNERRKLQPIILTVK